MADVVNEVVKSMKGKKSVELKKLKVRLEQEVSSIRDRVRDIEWRIDGIDNGDINHLMNERQRALDKLRETQKELLVVKEQLIEEGVE